MRPTALGDHVVASWLDSPWFDIHSLAASLAEGVVATFIGLSLLFLIKPRLSITPSSPRKRRPGKIDKRSETYAFRVNNRGFSKAIEVRVRLWKIRRHGSREPIELVIDELFELRGRLSPLDPSIWKLLAARLRLWFSGTKNRESARRTAERLKCSRNADKKDRARYTFYPCAGKLEEHISDLREQDYILVQVIAKNWFTNFSRLHKKRFYKSDLEKMARESSDEGSGSPPG